MNGGSRTKISHNLWHEVGWGKNNGEYNSGLTFEAGTTGSVAQDLCSMHGVEQGRNDGE